LHSYGKGVSLEKIALTISLGFVLGVTPVLGSTTLFCMIGAISVRFRKIRASRVEMIW
jgi:hypothetical protein